jgi:hypothetical protein
MGERSGSWPVKCSGTSDVSEPQPTPEPVDLGAYCRRVEEFLTEVNGGHLVRVVGPAFDLVRRWALSGVPLSIVFEGIRGKAARHQAGSSTRPLRLEFCADDVSELFRRWRRAVGVFGEEVAAGPDPSPSDDARSPRLTSLPRHLDRAIEMLVGAANRVNLSSEIRDALEAAVEALSALRAGADRVRGEKRAAIVEELTHIDSRLLDRIRAALGPVALHELADAAGEDIRGFRGRLAPDAWERSVNLGVDRLIRERHGLPVLELDA